MFCEKEEKAQVTIEKVNLLCYTSHNSAIAEMNSHKTDSKEVVYILQTRCERWQ